MGLVPYLMQTSNVYVVDHGLRDDGKWNEKDAGDYSFQEVRALLDEPVPAMLWNWKEKDDPKARNRKARGSSFSR